jgi:MFS family permease
MSPSDRAAPVSLPEAVPSATTTRRSEGTAPPDRSSLPPLHRDPAYYGITLTQFLGVFNDGIFKQIMTLLCAKVVLQPGSLPVDQQFLAVAIFSAPFVLFSGIAGFWSDIVSKRSLVVGCKVAEIVIMAAAAVAFWFMAVPELDPDPTSASYIIYGMPWLLLLILFFMGAQSAVFGPAKYGILPELVRNKDLPRLNGMVQMTTFLALVLSLYCGGYLLDTFRTDLWKAGLVCVGIAVAGTLASLWVRKTPVAQPDARFGWTAVAVAPETWEFLRRDPSIRHALLVYSIFWFVAAVLPLSVNVLGLNQFGLNYQATSLLLAVTSIGIALGFILAGKLSRDRIRFRLVPIGAWGCVAVLMLMGLPGGAPYTTFRKVPPRNVPKELRHLEVRASLAAATRAACTALQGNAPLGGPAGSAVLLMERLTEERLAPRFFEPELYQAQRVALHVSGALAWAAPAGPRMVRAPEFADVVADAAFERLAPVRYWPHLLGYAGSLAALVAAGFFAGFFALPVQVFLQARPPDQLKGRIIGTMNLMNWIFMILATVFYPLVHSLLQGTGLPAFAAFAVTALVLLPIAVLYHPPDVDLAAT